MKNKISYLIAGIFIGIIIALMSCLAYCLVKSNSNDNLTYGFTSINNMQNGETNNSSSSISYSAVTEITESTEIDEGEYISENEDENAVLVNGEIDVELSNISVEKTGDSDGGDDTSFYGINSAIIAKSAANLILEDAEITTDAVGANGIFSYGGSATTDNSSSDGTTVTISNSTITTMADNSGGIMTTGGGTMIASNLLITTSGISSAAIRTDRGGGNVTVTEGTYTTNGAGSPTIYSTAEVIVNDATLISNVAEGICIEGKNSVAINNCELTDSNTKLNGLSTTYKNIFLYQSMSGDADEGTSEFSAIDCDITTNNGDTIYVTNTTAVIYLENNNFINNDEDGNFLRAQADSWGNDGSNGGQITLTLVDQDIEGNIVIDSISTLDMTLEDSSYFEGSINSANEAKEIVLKLDSSSQIKLTSDSYVTSLEDEDSDYSNIDFNGYTLYVDGNALQ